MTAVQKGTNKFFIGDDENHPIGELTFKQKDATTIIADHTFVSEELRGEGLAEKLFNKLIEYARENELKIIPECSYVAMKMKRTSEYDDVLAK
jgi:predicted GNAT family acetyltransferase